ncbi:MAG: DNA-3-methyladenine glycosylase [Saprospirales bacterium]|nr:DNA-3-methyladenine glycosylase [Saprospirales bacterium]MBK8922187.1 DNA-3-methyladenine glycosylase [Saprospirales bacterium]
MEPEAVSTLGHTPLPQEFYLRADVLQVARELLGKVLITDLEGGRTAGLITEVEAYRAPDDRACHAYGNRRTRRTEVMFQAGGRAYIYLCYGIHHLFNVVTGPEGMAHAVLIRAVEPMEGLGIMLERRGMRDLSPALTTGPGALAQALGLHTSQTGYSLLGPGAQIRVEDTGRRPAGADIAAGARIGMTSAGECAAWEWRFWLRGSPYVKSGGRR